MKPVSGPLRLRNPAVAALLFCGALLAACGRAGSALAPAHPSLLATDANRERLVATITIPSLDRTLATAEALHADGVLPFGANELRQMIQARVNLPAELLDLVDTNKPINLAFVKVAPPAKLAGTPPAGATSADQTPPWFAGVITFKSLAAAAEKAHAAGKPTETRKDAQRFVRPDGSSLWVARVGDRAIWSDSFEGLSEAGSHAFAAPVELTDDLVATVFPASFLTATDKTGNPATAAANGRQMVLGAYESQFRARGQAPNNAERAALEAALDFVLPSLSESERVRVGLGLTKTRGIGLAVRATPRVGSGYAQRLAPRTPYRAPASFVTRASTVSLLATGPNPAWFELGQAVLDKQSQTGVPGAGPIAGHYRRLLPMLSGETFQSARSESETLALDVAFGLGPRATPTIAIETFAALLSEPALPTLLAQAWGRNTPQIDVARNPTSKERFSVTLTFPPGGRGPGPSAFARALSGSERVTFLVQATAGRLLVGSEPGAEDRQRALVAALTDKTPPPATAPIAGPLAETAGREGLFYVELWGFARPVLRAVLGGAERRMFDMMSLLPGLGSMTLPVWVSVEGGEALTTEVRIPVATLKNASTLLNLVGGAGGVPSADASGPSGATATR